MRRIAILIAALLPASLFAQDRYLVDWNEIGEEAI